MTITISITNKTSEPCKLIVDNSFVAESVVLNTVSFTGTNYKVFLPNDEIFRVHPLLYGIVPNIEEETPTDRTWAITLDEGRAITEGWAA